MLSAGSYIGGIAVMIAFPPLTAEAAMAWLFSGAITGGISLFGVGYSCLP